MSHKTFFSFAARKFDKYLPAQDYFQKALYMFDIGQNDLASAFYSKTFDQVLASIPTILVQLEDGIEVSEVYCKCNMDYQLHSLKPIFLTTAEKMIYNLQFPLLLRFASRVYMIKEQEIFGFTTQVPSVAYLRTLQNLELIRQS